MLSIATRKALGGYGISASQLSGSSSGHWLLRGNLFPHDVLLRECNACYSKELKGWIAPDAESVLLLLDRIRISSSDSTYSLPADDTQRFVLHEAAATYYHEGSDKRLQDKVIRLMELPPESWNTQELIFLLIHLAEPRINAEELSDWLNSRFGGLGAALNAEVSRLQEHPDLQIIGRSMTSQAFRICFLLQVVNQIARHVPREQIQERPVISAWSALIDYLHAAMQHETTEHFRILFLDRKNILIRDEVQSRGTVDHTPLYPREVVKRALELNASAIIMVHNHPSGDPAPSPQDIDMTRQVIAALKQVGVELHDHIIVGKNRHASFRSQKLI